MFNLFRKKEIKKMGLQNESYYNDKWPKSPIIYSGRALRGKKERIGVDVKNFISTNDELLKDIINKYKLKKSKPDDTALAVQQWVVKFLTYKYDDDLNQTPEFWQFPFETLQSQHGDCIATYEKIYTKNGIKTVGELNIGDEVLSYDFQESEYCYKPIIKIWEKGELDLFKVNLRNGQSVDSTSNHPFWSRTSDYNKTGPSIYKKTYLSDIDLSNSWSSKMPFVKKLPYEIIDNEYLDEDLCFVIGHYVAEGSKQNNRITTSGYDTYEEIMPILEEHGINFFDRTNNNGVPIITFKDDKFKSILKEFKESSLDITIPEWFFHLPENKLRAFLKGIILGDGYYDNRENVGGSVNNREWIIYTSCKNFTEDLQRIGLQLGESLSIYSGDRGGWGKNLPYAVYKNKKSHYYKNYGYKDISEISIKSIEDMNEKVMMRDFEVADTHTFIFKNGLISHQCEDGAILITALCIAADIPNWRVKVAAGNVQSSPTAPKGGHAWSIYLADDGAWRILDWCYFEDSKVPIQNKPLAKEGGYNKCYGETWFTFNNEYSWNQTAIELKGRISNDRTELSSNKLEENINTSSLQKIIEKIDTKLEKSSL